MGKSFIDSLFSDLTAEFESRMSSKNAELEKLSQDWEVKINNARQEHDVLMATLQTDHKMEIEKLKELQEHKLADLEREKQEILEGILWLPFLKHQIWLNI